MAESFDELRETEALFSNCDSIPADYNFVNNEYNAVVLEPLPVRTVEDMIIDNFYGLFERKESLKQKLFNKKYAGQISKFIPKPQKDKDENITQKLTDSDLLRDSSEKNYANKTFLLYDFNCNFNINLNENIENYLSNVISELSQNACMHYFTDDFRMYFVKIETKITKSGDCEIIIGNSISDKDKEKGLADGIKKKINKHYKGDLTEIGTRSHKTYVEGKEFGGFGLPVIVGAMKKLNGRLSVKEDNHYIKFKLWIPKETFKKPVANNLRQKQRIFRPNYSA